MFHKDQRPIIEFSIENRKALNARQKRLNKSREKNPTFKGNKVNDTAEAANYRPAALKGSYQICRLFM